MAGGVAATGGVASAAPPVAATPPAGTAIVNVAQASGLDVAGATQIAAASNAVTAVVQPYATPPAIAFYPDQGYASVTHVTGGGDPLFVEAAAPACNARPAVVDTLPITLTSQRTGDVLVCTAIETGPNTGRFRIEPNVPTQMLAPGTVPGNNTGGPRALATIENDRITASLLGCGGFLTQADVWVEPGGVVFDSRGGGPVAGARVTLVDVSGAGNGGVPGGAARVYQGDGVTPAPSVVVTDPSGRFAFPWLPPSTYRIDVAPPAGFTFPSALSPAALPSGHLVDPLAAYGQAFAIAAPGAPVLTDAPLDPTPTFALFVEKQASRAFAELGDEVDYTLRVANRSDVALTDVRVFDRLPTGFAFLAGTARRDTSALSDPAGRGPDLAFAIGDLAVNAVTTVRYRVRIGPGARDGDGINRAFARSGAVTSNEASARVQLTGGVFAEEATVLGTVFADHDGNGRRDAGDFGIPGVRLYLDDGTFAVTDRDGQYSFYGLVPRAAALKLDPTTLPAGTRLARTDHRQGASAGLRIVDLQRGDFQRADFAAIADSALDRAVAQRRAATGLYADETRRGVARELATTDDAGVTGDRRGRVASGLAESGERLPLFGDAARLEAPPAGVTTTLAPPAVALTTGPGAAPAAPAPIAVAPLESVIASLAPGVGFVNLADGDTLASDQLAVRVKGVAGLALELRVNGEAVPASRVGRKVTSAASGVEAWEYVGVRLAPGLNRLEVIERGPAGGESGRASLHVVAPDRLSRLEVVLPGGVPADGHTRADVRVRAVDARGVPASGRTLVTLESSLGEWRCDDLDPTTPGTQVAIENGEGHFALLAPAQPGVAIVRASSSATVTDAALEFVPELRPLLVVGTLEGLVRLDRLSLGALAPAHPRTGFEQPMTEFLSERVDGEASAAARAALFVKGRVRDDVLLTLGYDSDRPDGLRRLRDIQPDAYYPVYGDASVRGYDAQSTGRLFARLDRRGASLLYGDFVTRGAGGARTLSAYSRSLTGVQQHYESPRMSLDAFSSRERAARRVDELPGRGISGPYALTNAPIVENSERVEIVVRDRNQPAVVLSATDRSRFADYELDPLAGTLLFKSPVPSLDADLNPVFVRVSYEVERDGDAYWVSGVESRVKLGANAEVGGSYVDDHAPLEPYALRSVFAAYRPGTRTRLEGEYARSISPGERAGDGGRIELAHDGGDVNARVYAAVTSADFRNPTSGFGTGRSEAGGRASVRVSDRSRVLAEGLFSADASGDARRGGALVALDQGVRPWLRAELGVRAAGEQRRNTPVEPASFALRTKLLAQAPGRPELSAYGEFEQDVRESSRRMLALGGEYRFTARGRIYARHELISSLAGPYALDAAQRRLATVFGMDADLARNAHVFSEYRLADALAGRDAEAALGLRNAWTFDAGYRVGASFERVSPLAGASTGPITAITGSLETVADADAKASARLEMRTGRESDSYLGTMAFASRLDSAWTVLGRNLMSLSLARANGTSVRERMQFGFAYRRPDMDAWDALARYELHYDREPALGFGASRRVANVLSLHAGGRVFDVASLSLAWAGKLATTDAQGLRTSTRTHWVHGRWAYDFARVWDAGVNTSVLFGDGFHSRRDGLGLDVGRALADGVWLSAGWNRFGYQDDDLPEEAYTREGFYLRLRAAFDETMLKPARGGKP